MANFLGNWSGFAEGLKSVLPNDPTKLNRASTAGVQAAEGQVGNQLAQFGRAVQTSRNAQSAFGSGVPMMGGANINRAGIQNVDPQMVQGAQIGGAGLDASTAAQNFGLALLQRQAMGTAPSAAQLQLQSSQDAAIRAQMAQAASMRGNQNAGLIGRNVLDNQALIMQQGGQQAALLRAQEQAQGQQAFVAALAQARGQDIGLATDQAGLQQQALLANQQAALQGQLANQGMDYNTLLQNAGFGQQANAANQQANLSLRGLEAQKELQYAGLAGGLQNNLLQSQLGQYQTEQQRQAAITQGREQMFGGLASGFGATLGGFLAKSDERAKTDIVDAEKDMTAFADALSAKRYRYTSGGTQPGEAPGTRYGIMAQDLEKTPAGKSVVVDTPQGKYIDPVQGFGLALAALASVNKRVKSLEQRSA